MSELRNLRIIETRKIIRQTPSTSPPLLLTTVELCTLCTQYVFDYTFYLEQVKRFINNP